MCVSINKQKWKNSVHILLILVQMCINTYRVYMYQVSKFHIIYSFIHILLIEL